jgi:hypothetical protein
VSLKELMGPEQTSLPRDDAYIVTIVLQQYGLTSLNPTKWEDVESEDTAQLALDTDGLGGGTRDMDDPLGLRNKLTM